MRTRRGFTLIELMIVVAIVGILAMLGVVGYRKYVASAKTAEARNVLGNIGRAAATSFEKGSMGAAINVAIGGPRNVQRALCLSASSAVPNSANSIKGKKYQSTAAEWAPAADLTPPRGFPCLQFTMNEPQHFQYNYVENGAPTDVGSTFIASAVGDLNGDGVTSLFRLRGEIQAGLHLAVAPSIDETNPEE